MSKKDKELTKKEMEETVGGRQTRRTTEGPGSTEPIVMQDDPVEPLNDPPHGGLTPGGKKT